MSEQTARCYIHQIATAVPPQFVDAADTVAHLRARTPDERSIQLVRRVLQATGIRKRHLAALDVQLGRPPEEQLYPPLELAPQGPTTFDRLRHFDLLAAPLIEQILGEMSPAVWPRLRQLVTVNCTGAASPGLERLILDQRPISRRADRWHLGFMGCSAGLAGLRLLHGLCGRRGEGEPPGEPSRDESLLVALELSSLHVQYTDQPDQIVANALFADGAAAVTLSSQSAAARVVDCRCITLDAAADQMTWVVTNHGFVLHLALELPDTLAAHIAGAVGEFLGDNGLSARDVQHWAIHPGGPKIVESVCAALGLPEEAASESREVLREFGNMSSATIFFILQRMIAAGLRGPTVAMAFGPGLTIELALLDSQ
ncbi:MAG TPA: type III polyketide synthase [Phycisphaerae bacterium]